MPVRQFVTELITQAKRAAPQQLDWLVAQVSSAPFAEDLLEVDEPLWGGFWQGDVIAPGYSLPAVELALLRAIRLDGTWPEGTSVAQFLAGLHRAISDPHAGIWTLFVADEPCVIFASIREQGSGIGGQSSAVGGQFLATVVWYCATTERLHAGYRTSPDWLNFPGAKIQHPLITPNVSKMTNPSGIVSEGLFADDQSDIPENFSPKSLAARLDTEILTIRKR